MGRRHSGEVALGMRRVALEVCSTSTYDQDACWHRLDGKWRDTHHSSARNKKKSNISREIPELYLKNPVFIGKIYHLRIKKTVPFAKLTFIPQTFNIWFKKKIRPKNVNIPFSHFLLFISVFVSLKISKFYKIINRYTMK